jgi:phage terminase large subunit-like protein
MTTWKCRKKDYHPHIDSYIDGCRDGTIIVDNDILLALNVVESKLDNPDVFIDDKKIEKAIELMERYFGYSLFDWELFATALIHCYYKSNDTVVFDEIMIMMGRGNGKNGFISPISWYLTTHYHGIKGYNVEIIANSQDQAETSFNDVYVVLEDTWSKSKRFFHKTKEVITNLITRSYIKFHTSNPRTKDGKRSACLIFDEIHEYENYDMISVFTSGFGKRKHSRIFYITTQGHVREGVLDDKLKLAEDVLNGTIKELGFLPLLYRIGKEEEALDPKMWHKANPSLKYLPELKKQIEKEFIQMKYTPSAERDFYTKRMNWPKNNADIAVTDWKYIKATNRDLPDLTGWQCVVGIDYTKINDLASVDLHFRDGDLRYKISHSWLCLQSADLKRLKIPWKQWAEDGLLTTVDDVEINPYLLTDYIFKQMQSYDIKGVAVDGYRYALLAKALKDIGFDKEHKNLYLVRPSDIMKIVPVIDSTLVNQNLAVGDNPLYRWATNNTKKVLSGKKQGTDTGNYYYGKIEGKSRKTDPFMASVHSFVIEDLLDEATSAYNDLPVIT